MNIKNDDINLLMQKTSLNYEECYNLLVEHSGDIDKTLSFAEGLVGTILTKGSINDGIKNIEIYKKLAKDLSKYNTNRGGVNGFKGFVFEELHAANATISGQPTQVISNNGIADFKITTNNGTIIDGQAKVGYKNTSIDWKAYENQTIVIDKGNQDLINRAKEAGCDVVESNISEKEAQSLAKQMQTESKLTGKTNSTVVPKMHSTGQIAKQCHVSGVNAAKKGAIFGAGYSIGSNVIELMDGQKDLPEVAVDIAKDTAIAAGTSYAIGAVTTAVGSTTVGATAIGVATTAGAAVTGVATAAGTAVAGTAVGGAAIGAATAAGAAVAGTAVGAAAIAAAPVVLAGAAIGGVFTLGKKLFGR